MQIHERIALPAQGHTVHDAWRIADTAAVGEREGVVKYLLVFNPKAKRYSREVEARLVRQASRILGGTVAVTHTTPQRRWSRDNAMILLILLIIAGTSTVSSP